jgi:hypothetical protein
MQRVTVGCKQLAEAISAGTEDVSVITAARAQVIHAMRLDGERVRDYEDFLADLSTNRIGTRPRMAAKESQRG